MNAYVLYILYYHFEFNNIIENRLLKPKILLLKIINYSSYQNFCIYIYFRFSLKFKIK